MNYEINTKDSESIVLNSELYTILIKNCNDYVNKIADSFFSSVSKILHEYAGLYRNYTDELSEEQLLKVKECILLSKVVYKEAVEEKSIEKLLTCLHILFFFGQDFSILDCSIIDEDFKKKILTVTSGIELKVDIPSDAPYSSKKMMSVFAIAKEKNDFSEVIGVMDNLIYHSGVFSKLESSWASLINFAVFIDKKGIIKILEGTKSYEKIDFFLYALKDSFYENINFDVSNKYLLLRMFKYWLDYLESKYFKNRNEQNIPDYTKELVDIFSNLSINIEDYIEVSRLNHSESYNYLMGELIATNSNFLNIYLNKASFDKKSTNAFSFGFLQKLEKSYDKQLFESVCNTIGTIKSIFFEHEVHSFSFINQYTGYMDLFFNYFNLKNPNKETFLNTIVDFSDKIQQLQNSWHHEDITKTWVEFFYFCLSNICGRYIFTEAEIKNSAPVLFDERNKLVYDAESIEHMKIILMKPEEPMEVEFKTIGFDSVIVKFNSR